MGSTPRRSGTRAARNRLLQTRCRAPPPPPARTRPTRTSPARRATARAGSRRPRVPQDCPLLLRLLLLRWRLSRLALLLLLLLLLLPPPPLLLPLPRRRPSFTVNPSTSLRARAPTRPAATGCGRADASAATRAAGPAVRPPPLPSLLNPRAAGQQRRSGAAAHKQQQQAPPPRCAARLSLQPSATQQSRYYPALGHIFEVTTTTSSSIP